MSRASFGNERYEKAEFQERVAKVYKELKSEDWTVSNNIISCYINTSEIPSELSRENYNMLSSHVKRSPLLWLHNKSRLWKQADLVCHWCLYNKQNITFWLMDMNFIFLCSTWYLTCSLHSLGRYWVDHSKIKFISMCGHVISSIYFSEPRKMQESFFIP